MDHSSELLGARQHALLFGWIAQQTAQRFGPERGIPAMRAAVRQYGEQRGRRMALRAQAQGDPLDMLSFMLYREYPAPPDAEQEMRETVPAARLMVHHCPWNVAWTGAGILEFGRLYCLEIDHSVVRGFNLALTISVNSTLSNDGQPCDFLFAGARLDTEGAARMERTRARLGDSAVMPWSYHIGHLYRTAGDHLAGVFGTPGRAAAEAALAELAEHTGNAAIQTILAWHGTDFNQLPEASR